MLYHLVLSRDAQKTLDKLPVLTRNKIIRVLGDLTIDPFSGKKLRGELSGYLSARSWPFRVIYRIKQKQFEVLVLIIRHRKDAYR